MEQLRLIARSSKKKEAAEILYLLSKIFSNVITHPDEKKYREISTRAKAFTEATKAFPDEIMSIMCAFCFRKIIVDFTEKWVLSNLSPINKVKIMDFLSELDDTVKSFHLELENISSTPASESFKKIQEAKVAQRTYIDKILQDAHMDREEVKITSARQMSIIRKQQEERKRQEHQKVQQMRLLKLNVKSATNISDKDDDFMRDSDTSSKTDA